MARMIDADALKESVRKKFKAIPDRCEINELVNAAPTIDAIPVEWLKQQRECSDPKTIKDINGAFVTICIDGVLALWKKEQEAR